MPKTTKKAFWHILTFAYYFRESRNDHGGREGHEPQFGPVGLPQQAHCGLRRVRALHGDSRQRGLVRYQRGDPNGQLRDRRTSSSQGRRLGHDAASMKRTLSGTRSPKQTQTHRILSISSD